MPEAYLEGIVVSQKTLKNMDIFSRAFSGRFFFVVGLAFPGFVCFVCDETRKGSLLHLFL